MSGRFEVSKLKTNCSNIKDAFGCFSKGTNDFNSSMFQFKGLMGIKWVNFLILFASLYTFPI